MANPNVAANGLATESVWDYPRPPAVVSCERRVRVIHAGRTVAESDRALRVLETASPPTVYVPPEDVRAELLEPTEGHTVCEWKGQASYFDVAHEDGRAERAAWTYTEPKDAYPELRDHIAFYPGRVECYLDDERVRPQAGDFYGGWITEEIVGPHKGEPGTEGW
ncbi:MAG TPA: DUF427 domain-containing protein [Solirubrobacterales bacterium]|jgi:uncharacterized protein (DUF427 family)